MIITKKKKVENPPKNLYANNGVRIRNRRRTGSYFEEDSKYYSFNSLIIDNEVIIQKEMYA